MGRRKRDRTQPGRVTRRVRGFPAAACEGAGPSRGRAAGNAWWCRRRTPGASDPGSAGVGTSLRERLIVGCTPARFMGCSWLVPSPETPLARCPATRRARAPLGAWPDPCAAGRRAAALFPFDPRGRYHPLATRRAIGVAPRRRQSEGSRPGLLHPASSSHGPAQAVRGGKRFGHVPRNTAPW